MTYTWAIRFYRRHFALTVAQMADLIGCNTSTIYRFESGQIKQPRSERAKLIRQLLKKAKMPIGGLE